MPRLRRLLDGDPRAIGDFRLLARLGGGGFGDVYVAKRRRHPEQLAAVKVLRDSLGRDPNSAQRFLSEITAIRDIKSAYMPKFREFGLTARGLQGVTEQYPWVATRLIAGLPLKEIINRCGPLPEKMVWHLGAGIFTAIADIHDTGQVHRDLKPDNVLVAINGPWVIDLGLSHLMGTRHLDDSRYRQGPFQYAAPEWWKGGLEAAGTMADIYSLGAVLLFAATGHAPYPAEVLPPQVESSPPDLHDLPEGPLGELIESCLIRIEQLRPKLAELRTEFSLHTSNVGRSAFPDMLPKQVTSMLVEHLGELADVTGTWGPAKLGWGPDLRQSLALPPREKPVQRRKRRDSLPDVPSSPALTAEWSVNWTCEVEGWIRGPLAVHEDMVVVATLDGSVTTISTQDGTPPTIRAESVRTGAVLHAGPVVVPDGARKGTAYVGDADGFVRAIELLSGQEEVVLETGAAIESTPVTVRSSIPGTDNSAVMADRLYAVTSDGVLHSVDLRTRESMVLYRMEHPATGMLATSSGLIFAACADGSVSAIDAITGERAWQLPTDGQVLAAPLKQALWLYVCGTDGVLRQVPIEGGQKATAKVGAPVHCAPVGDMYRVYVAGCDGVVSAYNVSHPDREELDLAWTSDVGDEVAGLAVTPTGVYVSAGQRLMELDRTTGHATRKPFPMDSPIATAPVISGRNCYVASLGGVVRCLSLA